MQAIYQFDTQGQFCGFYLQLTKEEAAYFQKASQEQANSQNEINWGSGNIDYSLNLDHNVIYIDELYDSEIDIINGVGLSKSNYYQAQSRALPVLISTPSTEQLAINDKVCPYNTFTSAYTLIDTLLTQFPDAPEQMRETMHSIKRFIEKLREKYNQTSSEATSANISCMDLYKSQAEEFQQQLDDTLDKVIPVKDNANSIKAYLGLMIWTDADVFASDEPSMTEASQRSMVIS